MYIIDKTKANAFKATVVSVAAVHIYTCASCVEKENSTHIYIYANCIKSVNYLQFYVKMPVSN